MTYLRKGEVLTWVTAIYCTFTLGCIRASGADAAKQAEETTRSKSYRNTKHNLAFSYPASWEIEKQGYTGVTLIPTSKRDWKPERPSDLARNPRIEVRWSKWVAEVAPKHFPKTITAAALQRWLESYFKAKVTKRKINGKDALELLEERMPVTERVVYWRPTSLDALVRVATSVENPDLADFERVVETLQSVPDR